MKTELLGQRSAKFSIERFECKKVEIESEKTLSLMKSFSISGVIKSSGPEHEFPVWQAQRGEAEIFLY